MIEALTTPWLLTDLEGKDRESVIASYGEKAVASVLVVLHGLRGGAGSEYQPRYKKIAELLGTLPILPANSQGREE